MIKSNFLWTLCNLKVGVVLILYLILLALDALRDTVYSVTGIKLLDSIDFTRDEEYDPY